MYASLEKIENKIWSYGSMSLMTVVINGQKNTQDKRRDAYYCRTYDSQKYDDRNQLETLQISAVPYLVLSYKAYNDNNDFISEEVYMSFKQIDIFKTFVEEVFNQLNDHIDEIYKDKGIAKKYEELAFESDPLIQDKTITIYPEKLQTDEGVPYNGVVFMIRNADGDEVYQEISFDSFWTLVGILQSYDLLNDSRLTSIQGMLYQLLSNGGNSSGSSRSTSSLKGRSGSSNKRFSRSPVKSIKELIDEDEEEIEDIEEVDEEEADEVEEEVKPRKTSKKVVNKNKPTAKPAKKKKAKVIEDDEESISLDDMLNAAEEVEFSLEDGDEEGESF